MIVYCRLKLAFVPTMVYRGNDKPMLTYRANKDYVDMAKLQVKTIFLKFATTATAAKAGFLLSFNHSSIEDGPA